MMLSQPSARTLRFSSRSTRKDLRSERTCPESKPTSRSTRTGTYGSYIQRTSGQAIERFSLDFTGKSTISFQDVVYLNTGGVAAAFFPVVQDESKTSSLGASEDTNTASDDPLLGDRPTSSSTGNLEEGPSSVDQEAGAQPASEEQDAVPEPSSEALETELAEASEPHAATLTDDESTLPQETFGV